MVKAIEHIRRDLELINDKTAKVKQNLEAIYTDYLEILGQGIERQLVMAGYQLCTQIYPDTFLGLSYDERQQLQQGLRHIGATVHSDLNKILTEPEPEPEPQDEDDLIIHQAVIPGDSENLEKELLAVFENIGDTVSEDDAKDKSPEPEKKSASEDSEENKERREELSKLAERIAASIADMIEGEEETKAIAEGSPEALVEWLQKTEKRITQTLNKGSNKTNIMLRNHEILPKQVPSKMLKMAVQNNRQPAVNAQLKNLVNLVIDAEIGDDKRKRVKVTAIHLKLSEIEFEEAKVMGQRSRIREELAKIKQLKKHYKKTTKDLAIAKAQAAWRSSWHEGELRSGNRNLPSE